MIDFAVTMPTHFFSECTQVLKRPLIKKIMAGGKIYPRLVSFMYFNGESCAGA